MIDIFKHYFKFFLSNRDFIKNRLIISKYKKIIYNVLRQNKNITTFVNVFHGIRFKVN